MNENLASKVSKRHYVILTKSLVKNKCHGTTVGNICHMPFKVNLCGHLSWATLHVVANIYHVNRTVLHVAVPAEGMKMWSRKRNCSAKWKKKLGKSKSRKIRHWWGVADHQSAICHLCGWKRFLGGAWKGWQQKLQCLH